ncbi:MAG: hypothetical protein KJ856_06450 [Gammaproteobacteria bacterium]|jgi:hypothetical protein|uniref:Uncharacterized protein n=1 Tax=Shewanella vaxholmensis TaxID=3063535 RepID=A0ABU9UNY0_9GAMM|nr:hypothetical protein [Shewanella hafniensis]MBU1392135.1 hypothetical protein [Gammaproteobacteria bacterium]QYX64684.1 hypothetical protein K2227_21500 [Shewanella putrefaciens]MBU1477942.1 hypothetical protein [Gammaproteobacteria bacterium]MBU2000840.1 hypothetical protein [Gammaproteobacteria bacterium]MBU2132991.1 hypothetical protein [Gammaproteobacteria bacterium]
MSTETPAEENLISQAASFTRLHAKETMQFMCLFAILSTYLFVILKPSIIQNNKALGDK